MSTGVPLAGGKSEIFEIVLKFMPEWVQVTVLALIVLIVVVSWIITLKNKIARRRAARAGLPVHAVAQSGQGRGADYLGAYAPQQAQAQAQAQARTSGEPRQEQPSGADFLGAYAPQQTQRNAAS
ncbi:hypothetical protein FNH04_27720 [Streptomyces phyllanthi]|uniref:Uncharacterized protein n=2 Tax=Streptomyces phyllanthi TaxID=1803180 RepID=A0A5N8W7V9_9ACTN|nr:hypothetical protein [Streptomyces phyllanthi]